jgi:hypothetical protein
MFALEALAAKHGDALLLHYGEDPQRLVIIDGGPTGIYDPTMTVSWTCRRPWSTAIPGNVSR